MVDVRRVERTDVAWLEREFNARWPWPRSAGFVAGLVDRWPHDVAVTATGRYLGHCHVREGTHGPFAGRSIPEIADLNVMPDSRRRGAATRLLDAAEGEIATRAAVAGIAVGVDDDGPAQRLSTSRGYVLDGTGAWVGNNRVRGDDLVRADDDLVLYLTKRLR